MEKKLRIELVGLEDARDSQVWHCLRCNRLEDSAYHLHVCPKLDVPAPDDDVGRNLTSVAQVREWLSHPANQRPTRLFNIGWRNVIPLLAEERIDDLWRDTILAECVLWEHRRRKSGAIDPDLVGSGEG